MIYLALNILFSSAFTLIIKWVQVRGREDIVTVGPINYVTAAVLITPSFLAQDATPEVNAALCGGAMGAVYFIAFFFVIYAIKHVGAAATTVVSSLSLLMPIIVAAFLWEEIPNAAQGFGIACAVAALALIGVRRRPGKAVAREETTEGAGTAWLVPVVLIVFFLLCGCSRLAQRTLHHVCEDGDGQKPTFLFAAFCMASLPSLLLLEFRQRRIKLIEVGMGVAMGASNILQSHFILAALESAEGYIVFPVSSSGGMILTTLVATSLLREKISRQTLVGICAAVAAMVLLNAK